MKSIGFGLERVALLAVIRPWIAIALLAPVLAIAGFGLSRLAFDDDLRNVFAGGTTEFANYANATEQFVDPENELIVLVEGNSIGEPATFEKLRALQFELLFVDGVAEAFSLFALRYPPDDTGSAPLLVDDQVVALDGETIDRIRAHPILGAKLLSADAASMIYIVTPEQSAAPLGVQRIIAADIEATADDLLAGTGLAVTITGFPLIRAGIVDILIHDQSVLNLIGAAIGLAMSLAIFGSLTAAIMISIPAILSGLVVAGGLGAAGIPITVMTNVVPVLVMILGFANSMHLCRAWRSGRDAGMDVIHAAHQSIATVGPACILASLTTSVAFLSLTFSNVQVVSDFGWVGAIGCILGALVVLMLHGLLTVTIGRFWKSGAGSAATIIVRLERPSRAIGQFAVDYARPLNILIFTLVAVLGVMYAALAPEYSIRENLPANNPANAALGRIDSQLGGSFPVHIVLPLSGSSDPTSPEALATIGAVHEAIAKIEGVGTPLSLWSLVSWLGSDANAGQDARFDLIIDELAPATRQRFFGKDGGTLITASIREAPSAETEALIDTIEATARAAGGNDLIVTGVTVLTARESSRTISNLNLSLLGAVLSGILVILIAFRNLRVAITSIIPNVLPLLGTGALLFLLGRGMQMNGVLALTIAFGIAVDGTIHYFNYFFQYGSDSKSLRDNLRVTSCMIGPQLIGTTVVLVSGLAATQISEMPTVVLFGTLAAVTILTGLVGDLVVLPALMAGAARRWFTRIPEKRSGTRGAV